MYGHEQQPSPRNHEGEKEDQSNRGDIEPPNVAENQDTSTDHLSHEAGDGPGKPVGTKIRLTTAPPRSLHLGVHVAHRGNGRDHEPLGAHGLVALPAHEGEGTDYERRREAGEHINRA